VRIVFFSFRIESNSYRLIVETRRAFLSASSSEVMQSSFTTCGLANAHIGLRSMSCDRDHSLTASTNSGQAYSVDHASPRSQCGRLKAAISCEQCPSHSLSRLLARQAKLCCYVIKVYAIETRFRSLPAAAAARICFAYMRSHPAPVHCTGVVTMAGTTAAFDAGVIGGRDQIHAAHGRTHA